MFHDEEPANTAIVTRYVCSWCFTALRGGERTPLYISTRNGADWVVCRPCSESEENLKKGDASL